MRKEESGTPSSVFYLAKENADGEKAVFPLTGTERIGTICPECDKIIEIPNVAFETVMLMAVQNNTRITCPDCHISRMVIVREGDPVPPECEDDGIIYINSAIFGLLAKTDSDQEQEETEYFVQVLTGIANDLDDLLHDGTSTERLMDLKYKVDDEIAQFTEDGEAF